MPLRNIDIVILAGGLGSRLRSVIHENQKVIAKVNGTPVIDYILDLILQAGAKRIIFALGYKSEQVVAYLAQFSNSKTQFFYSVEEMPLGTAGALSLAKQYIRSKDVLVLNGDSFINVDYASLVAFHQKHRASGTLVTTHVEDVSRFGSVDVSESGNVLAFNEKLEAVSPGYVSAGVYLLGKKIIMEISDGIPASLEHDIFPKYVYQGLFAQQVCEPFIDIGIPSSFEEAHHFFKRDFM